MTGQQLRAARKSLSQTQAGLAFILGVARNTISRWEKDEWPLPKWVAIAMKGLGAEIPRASQKPKPKK